MIDKDLEGWQVRAIRQAQKDWNGDDKSDWFETGLEVLLTILFFVALVGIIVFGLAC